VGEARRIKAARTVFLVDDHGLFRSGIRTELGGRVRIVGEAGTVPEAIDGILSTAPAVVLLDVHLPDGGGRAVLEGVRSNGGEAAFLALSASDAAEDVIGIIRSGARGYVTKSVSADELVEAIDRVAAGDAVFSPRLAGGRRAVLAATSRVPIEVVLDPSPSQERWLRSYVGSMRAAYNWALAEVRDNLRSAPTSVPAACRGRADAGAVVVTRVSDLPVAAGP
jgi:DNA-binding NarL/FixJ family response regulator